MYYSFQDFSLFIHHKHQTRYQLLARHCRVTKIYLVYIGDVKADALGVWGIIENKREDGFIHVHGIANLTNYVDRGIGIDRTDEDDGLGNVNGIDNQFLVVGTAVDAFLINPIGNVIFFQNLTQTVGRFFVLARITDKDLMLH